MTVSSTQTRVSYSGNGTTTAFAVPFYFLANSDLLVVLRSSAGVETTQVLNTNYTVTGAGVLTGGTVTMTSAPASGVTVVISRNAPLTQTTDLLPNDRLPAESIETALDKATMLAQQLDEVLDRSIKFPLTDATSISSTLPVSSERANKYLKFTSGGAITVDAITQNFRNVKDFGAIGDGTTDDTAAINATIAAANTNGTVFFPKGTYLVSGTLQMLSGQCFMGEGGSMQGTSTINKGANGDLINMVGRCRLENLNLDSVGATYTGRGIFVSTGLSQVINNVRSANNVTYALEYEATSGGGTFVTNFVADMIAASADTAAIKVGENYPTNVLRFFQNIWLSNGKFDLTNTVAFTLDGFFCRGFITGPTFDKCVVNKIANGRVSTPGTPLVLSMADSSIVNVPISGTTHLTSCQGLMLANCQFDTLTIDNSSISPAAGGVAACFITDRQRVYTPTWSQASGTGPVLGNGTIESLVTYNGFKVEYYMRLVMGGTTTYGDSTGAWTFSLPRIASATGTPSAYNQRFGAAYMKLNSGNFIYLGEVAIGAGELVLSIGYQNQSVRGTWPYTWASGDILEFSISYLAP